MAMDTTPVEEAHQKIEELLEYDNTRQDEIQNQLEAVSEILLEFINTFWENGMTPVPDDVLATVAFSLAPEVLTNDDMELLLPDGDPEFPPVYELRDDWDGIEAIEDKDRGFGVRFFGEVEVFTSRLVSRGSYWHPPEYESEPHPVLWSLEFYPADQNGFGSARLHAEGI